jgi:hypothetical protein
MAADGIVAEDIAQEAHNKGHNSLAPVGRLFRERSRIVQRPSLKATGIRQQCESARQITTALAVFVWTFFNFGATMTVFSDKLH